MAEMESINAVDQINRLQSGQGMTPRRTSIMRDMKRRLVQSGRMSCVHTHALSTYRGYSAIPTALALDPFEGRFLLVGQMNSRVSLEQIQDDFGWAGVKTVHKPRRVVMGDNSTGAQPISCLAWYPVDNGLFAVCDSKNIYLCDTNTAQSVDCVDIHSGHIEWIDWNPNNSNLIAAGASESRIKLYDIVSGDFLYEIAAVKSVQGGGKHSIRRVVWSPHDEECLVVGDTAGFLQIFDIRSPRKPVQIVNDTDTYASIETLRWTPDGLNLITTRGIRERIHKFTFSSRRLVRDVVHFSQTVPAERNPKSAYGSEHTLPHDIYVTNDFVFTPNGINYQNAYTGGAGSAGNSIMSSGILAHNLHTGRMVAHLRCNSPSGHVPVINITGSFIGSQMQLISASKGYIKLWGPEVPSDEKIKRQAAYYQDDWSE